MASASSTTATPGSAQQARSRLEALRRLLEQAEANTQEDLREALVNLGFEATQSTISRSLRKLGAIRTVDEGGRTVYRLATIEPILPPTLQTSISDLVLEITSNGSIIVIKTPPGSAPLVARHLDHSKPEGILGTIAGDDTIFVAPRSVTTLERTLSAVRESFGL
jgi:transcriptional regulator of arginine metabolism